MIRFGDYLEANVILLSGDNEVFVGTCHAAR
jgi:hypothetical protein